MKYILTPGHLVYIITFGIVEEAYVVKQVSKETFAVQSRLTGLDIEATYGNDMFLTLKKANSELSSKINKVILTNNHKQIVQKQVVQMPTKKYIVCEKCGSVSNSGKACECRYGQ